MTMNENKIAQIKRIQKMQANLEALEDVTERFETVLDELETKQEMLQELSRYYGEEEWYEDIQSYTEGKLPEGQSYSVLGEDPVFDLLTNNYKLAIRLLETATHIIKQN